MFKPPLYPNRMIFLLVIRRHQRDKNTTVKFWGKPRDFKVFFQSDKVSSNRSKQAENMWMKYRWRQRQRGRFREEAPVQPVRQKMRTMEQNIRLRIFNLPFCDVLFLRTDPAGQYDFISFFWGSFNPLKFPILLITYMQPVDKLLTKWSVRFRNERWF